MASWTRGRAGPGPVTGGAVDSSGPTEGLRKDTEEWRFRAGQTGVGPRTRRPAARSEARGELAASGIRVSGSEWGMTGALAQESRSGRCGAGRCGPRQWRDGRDARGGLALGPASGANGGGCERAGGAGWGRGKYGPCGRGPFAQGRAKCPGPTALYAGVRPALPRFLQRPYGPIPIDGTRPPPPPRRRRPPFSFRVSALAHWHAHAQNSSAHELAQRGWK